MWPLGAEVAAYRCHKAGFRPGKIVAAIKRAQEQFRCDTLCADVFLVFQQSGASWDEANLFINEVLVPYMLVEGSDQQLHAVQFQNSIIGVLEVSSGLSSTKIPRFLRCHFGLIEGFSGEKDLPPEVFAEVTIDSFENTAQTTNAILSLALPLGTRVLLTILKKLYAQRGSGRRDSALYRGLDTRAQEIVPGVLNLLRREGIVVKNRQAEQIIWRPSKSPDARRRVLSLMAAPTSSADPLLAQSRDLD